MSGIRPAYALTIRDLSVDLEEFHLHGIELSILDGEYLVILGPTGAGKTVLLEAIAGLHTPDQGSVLINDRDVTSTPPEHRGIGFVYQDYVLFPHMSVAENIAFGLKLRGQKKTVTEAKVQETAQLLGVPHLLHRDPKTLSGGERQRVALARALVLEPDILLLDEPLSALDPETKEGLQRELARVHRELGTTTVHVTHDFEEAVALGDRIAVMHEGRLRQVGEPDDIFRRPASEFVARFVGTRNIFEGDLERLPDGSSAMHVDGTDIVVLTKLEGHVHASLRPEDIVLSYEPLRSSARNVFQGEIADIVDRGTIIYVTVDVPPTFTCVITRRSLEEMGLHEGMEMWLAFKASALHVF